MVVWAQTAKDDLKRIFSFIAEDSRYYATEVSETILELTLSLAVFPLQGRTVPEIKNPSIRELIVYSYRVIYEVKKSGVFILAIVHMKQKLKKVK